MEPYNRDSLTMIVIYSYYYMRHKNVYAKRDFVFNDF